MSARDIAEAWDFHDEELASALGKKSFKTDDDMYAEILGIVRKNPLNQKLVPKGFSKYVRPILLGKL
jgi:hypothetical protein